jgi:predicted metalloendopeptidase
MNPSRFVLHALAGISLLALVAAPLPANRVRAEAGALNSPGFPKPGIDVANIDPMCKACDDFYGFATGGWQKSHPIPAGFSRWGSFSVLAEANRNVLHDILESAASNAAAAPGSNEQKIGTFYRTCMDEAAVEAAGVTPLRPELDRIAGIADRASLLAEIAHLQQIGVDVPLNFGSSPDRVDSSREIARLATGGLGLPDRDFYFRDDAKSESVRSAYGAYVATMLRLTADAAPNSAGPLAAASQEGTATAIVALETALAKGTPERSDLRDPLKTYHPTQVTDLGQLAPGIAWPQFFSAFGAPAFASLNVVSPDYVKGVAAQIDAVPLPVWQAYLRYHLVDAYAAALPTRFDDAHFAFHSTTLLGVKEQLPRWKRCTAATDESLGEALGAVYVAAVFPAAARARARALVDNLQSVLHDDIGTLSWMSDSTKAYAQTKLAAFSKKIGYPDRFRDYSALDIRDGPYAVNVQNANAFDAARYLRKIGTLTDRGEWGMTPPTVNAYYNPSNNEIVFPAGILEPPFFSEATDDAVNYGAIGAVIGHEMTHGFDNSGRRYDARGNVRDWWTSDDAANFTTRAQCIIDEYSGFSPAPGVNIQGKLVQGEAIADLGGITIAYKAFARTREFASGRKIDGYTPQQRFFLAFANLWAQNEFEDAARTQALTNEHPDARYRVIGTLSNMPEFRAAFGCVAGDRMVRAASCQIW